MSNLILQNAERLREMNKRIKETFRIEPHGSEHKKACELFHKSYDSLAFPGGLSQALDRIKNQDPSIVDEVIDFLNTDPHYFRSGYHKENMIRKLKTFDLSKLQQARLTSCILRSIDGGPKRIYLHYARLAQKIAPALLVSEIETRLNSDQPEIERRAKHVQQLISKK